MSEGLQAVLVVVAILVTSPIWGYLMAIIIFGMIEGLDWFSETVTDIMNPSSCRNGGCGGGCK